MRPYCAGAFLFYGHESSSSCSFESITFFIRFISLFDLHQNSRIVVIPIVLTMAVELLKNLIQWSILRHPCLQKIGLHALIHPVRTEQQSVSCFKGKLPMPDVYRQECPQYPQCLPTDG